ncbi:MAG: biopolymer transporter ExbD [candidate division KSB1 bacterium]|jgi:biopolymer transport protein ExbD|nr:biopolymer transporter ExbD [candidate division KSB1 bacterium]
MKLLEKQKRKVIINITSLIDVLFLLLIFFMVSSTFLEQPGMKLELPETKSHESEKIDKLVLQMFADQGMNLNGESITSDQLKNRFEELLPSLQEKTLVLKADRLVSHGEVVEVMDVAKLSGLEKIVIATRADVAE